MNMTEIQGLLFDLDGTLVDSAPDLARAVDRMLADFGYPPVGEARVRNWVGNGAARLVQRALTGEMDGAVDDKLAADALERFFLYYGNDLCGASRLYDGVAAAVTALRAEGYRLAVVTNKPARYAEPLLRGLGIADCFAAVVGGDTLPFKKPHPQPLLHAAELLGCSVDRTLMVGDSRHDIQAARAARMPVVCVPYGYNHGKDIRDYSPDSVIDNLQQLLPMLSKAA